MCTLTHSHAVERVRFALHTFEALVTDAIVVERTTAILILHPGAILAAATYPHHRPSRAAEIYWAFPHVAGDASQCQAVLHQQDCQKLTDQQTLQIHCGAELEK